MSTLLYFLCLLYQALLGSSRAMSADQNLQDQDEIPLSLMPSPKGKGKAPEASFANKKKRNDPGA
ncbi:hypothetical protein PGTUg99_004561 [Puccinia graminis f. sp. tritici]|uniref:Uncharacterized protein n=1 Tax=Puccinia graminis f. sp. tritici TaxID=56615 RepID=A0A5B0LIS6_PUCGR|nr:hypothetical protein PGTUg99_004561 [Puccinia graminis f. sp. tritici]